MAWETRSGSGNYYTRSRRVNGRVVREYIGSGECAAIISELDRLDREQKQTEWQAWCRHRDNLTDLDQSLQTYCDEVQLITELYLYAAGYHQHKRTWRRRRETTT